MSSIEDAPSDSYPNQPSELRSRIRSCLHALKKVDDLQMIKDTIGLAREAYALSIENKTDRHQACLLLAESIRQGFNRCADDRLLEEMIMLEREALTLAPERHPKRAVSCGSLASSLWTCYMRTGDISLLNEAIELERETFNLQPEGHPERAKSCGNLANSLRTCYDRTGDLGLLDEAIDLQREALALRSNSGHPGRSLSCGNLAISLKTRYERTGNIGLLDEAIDLQREALDLRPQGHPGRSMSCGNLASSLWMRYERTGDVDLLDEAIDLQRNALDLLPAGHPHYSWSCGNLATSLKTRYERTGDVDLLDEAIDLQRKALDLRPEGHPYRSSSCGNLATSLKTWYARMGDVRCLDEAIGLQREALDLRPEGHPYRSLSCEILASSLKTRYERTGDVGLLDEAIALQREALNLRPQGHPYRYMSFGNLATSLKIRYERTDDVALLHDSLILSQSAVAIAPVHAIWRYLHHLAHMHLMNTSPSYDVNKAILYLSKSLEHDPDDTLAFVVSLSSILDDFWEYNLEGKHIQLTTIYQRLVNLLPLLVHPALGIQPQLQALKRCTRLGSDAFVNAALADSCSVGLEALELAQGVIWSQSLHRRDPQLKDVPDHLASKLQSLLRSFAIDSAKGPAPQIDDEEQRWLTPRDMVHAQNSRAHAVIREIRALPGLDRFMLGETFETLRTVASDHPVVVLVGARGDYYALIMSPSLAQEALLSLNLTSDDEMTLLFTKTSRRQSRGGLADEPGVDRGLRIITPSGTDSLGRQFKVLWNKVVKPVFDHLDLKPSGGHHRPRLHWCPTGIFSTLPLHAAGIYGGSLARRVCCADFVVPSYTPTITTLLRAQLDNTPESRINLSVALVAEKQARDTNLPVINAVDKEIEHVVAVANSSSVDILHHRVGSTTMEDTSIAMQAAKIVHLACHGIQDTRDATQSGFCLGDGRLTISKLMELKLDNAFLAFLSACETAKGDKEQPDQAMHLAAVMLFSGFKSVVATMWAISDIDGPKVAKWFYEELFSKDMIDSDAVAHALDFAVGKLRDSGVSPERWAPFIHMGA